MTLYESKPSVPNQRALRDMVISQYQRLKPADRDLPLYPRPGMATNVIKIIQGETVRTKEQRIRLAATLWAASQVVLYDLESDEEVAP